MTSRIHFFLSSNNLLSTITDSECYLYSRKVAEHWAGTNAPGAVTFTSCFTSWVNQFRIIPVAVDQTTAYYSNTAGTGPLNHTAELAINGYIGISYVHCSITKYISNPWWWADLGTSKTVSKVVVHSRQDYTGQFNSILIRLGDSLIHEENPPFALSIGPPPSTRLVSFEPNRPRRGRYLSIHSRTHDHLSMCDVEILS